MVALWVEANAAFVAMVKIATFGTGPNLASDIKQILRQRRIGGRGFSINIIQRGGLIAGQVPAGALVADQ